MSSSNSKEESLSDQGKISVQFKEDNNNRNIKNETRNSQRSDDSSDSQDNYVRFNLDQLLNSNEIINNTSSNSSSEIKITSKMEKYFNSSNSSNNSKELDDLMKSSNLDLSEGNYSISDSSKKKN